ncbi:hypothetical protein ACFQZJ_14445 [Maribacter chungangensis]|uniref:DUF4890 domain-containing protein n=1 Tax=Maribacter chungangensis TaxID=1069117 RepID=A0ABW3B6N7_9FLAO
MKKLALIVLLFSGVYLTAQGHSAKHNGMKDLNPEQIAKLQTKKMTLALDLNQNQQTEIEALLLSNATYRKNKMEEHKAKKEEGNRPSKEERFAMQNERLDRMIAQKVEMKKILTLEQFEKWEKIQHSGKNRKKGQRHRKSKR